MFQRLMTPLIMTRLFRINASIIMGFFTWYLLMQFQVITVTWPLPLYFDNLSPDLSLQAPEQITVTLQGTRKLLYSCKKTGAIHLNGASIKPGKNYFLLKQNNLLLPTAIKLVNYTPVEIIAP